MQIRIKLIDALPRIIAESVKPMENIDGIKILHVDGLNGSSQNGGGAGEDAGGRALPTRPWQQPCAIAARRR
ncbi:MAG: hypothetical protein MO846_10320 [Candidatus Devosia symbiotica]|nr:hypothetical protein [Candidatus Devosia symbiotica]